MNPSSKKGADPMSDFMTGGTGTLRVQISAAESALPITGAKITVYEADTQAVLYEVYSDENGNADGMTLDCPPLYFSLNEDNTIQPYGTYNLKAESEEYVTSIINAFQVFDGQVSLAQVYMKPKITSEQTALRNSANEIDVVDTPAHALLNGTGGSALAPNTSCSTAPILLTEVIIPKNITVHLGKPSESAQDVTVPFIDYVKNVASSEIYPTWPQQSLRANIHAQISVVLNRIYTEWYKSKGYNFQITNSTSYDQYYVHGRTIYDSVSVIADDIFNTYIRETGTVNPYFSEYCDGKQVTCPGMKQWGTVTLAEQGYSAPEILEYYYGSNIEIIRTDNIQSIQESYPGTPLTIGSTGTYVKIIQRQLNRIAEDYPSFGTLSVDGVFGSGTAEVVKKFQAQFNLSADGIVGRTTWYKISYIYVAVKDLAELTSEGEKPTGDLVDGEYPGTSLSVGSSGDSVLQAQFWLDEIAEFVPQIPSITVDGQFGAQTKAAVEAFQAYYGLEVDGVIGNATWDALYKEYKSGVLDTTPGITNPGQYPGTVLSVGSSGDDVKRMQFYLRIVARNNNSVPDLTVDGIFGSGTQTSVIAFQSYYGLVADGFVGKLTWDKLYEIYTDIINGLLDEGARPGIYPGTALRVGSTGTAVKEMQYYLNLLSAYYRPLPVITYDGVFGEATENAVKVWQEINGLSVDGVIGPVTWDSIYGQFSKLRTIDGPVTTFDVYDYPGYVIQQGMQGDDVLYIQYLLKYISPFYEYTRPAELTGTFDEQTVVAVESFQKEFGLDVDGAVGNSTWDALAIIYLTCTYSKESINPVEEGEYAGTVLSLGSTGLQVLRLQTYMDTIATRYCEPDFVTADGIFGNNTLTAVQSFQENFGLQVTGFVDKETWDTIYSYYISSSTLV